MTHKHANKELEEILDQLLFDLTTKKPNVVKTALQQINSLMISKAEVLGAIPKKRQLRPRQRSEKTFMAYDGYNKAINDFKLNLKPLLGDAE